MKIHYYSFASNKSHAADRRRFFIWAFSKQSKAHKVEIFSPFETGDDSADLTIASTTFDLHRFCQPSWPSVGKTKVLHLVDGYGLYHERPYRDFLRGVVKFFKGEISRPVISYSSLVKKAIRAADSVICASVEQAQRVRELNERVIAIPDNHSFLNGRVITSPCAPNSINLLWEGLPESLSPLFSLGKKLKLLNDQRSVHLHIVTNLRGQKIGGTFLAYDVEKLIRRKLSLHVSSITVYQWSETQLLAAASVSNVAILPVNVNSPLHRLKHESRMLLYWQLGLPVVYAKLPSYSRVAKEAGVEDLVFESPNQFSQKIDWLCDKTNWQKTVMRINEFMQIHHSKQVFQEKWDEVVNFLISQDSRNRRMHESE